MAGEDRRCGRAPDVIHIDWLRECAAAQQLLPIMWVARHGCFVSPCWHPALDCLTWAHDCPCWQAQNAPD
jgi:hypothetical protein